MKRFALATLLALVALSGVGTAWAFNDDNSHGMKPVFSTPCFADGRLYVGEGFHEHSACKLYCLSADKGDLLWEKKTAGHTESSPCAAEGRVFFGAGDDGLAP